ncbi:MAG: ATP-dependent RNA helicase HrpA [Desulfobacterales bacterium]|nr:ATP-dependent RNA helicase HrpA [Desulfobacterales bacterium]
MVSKTMCKDQHIIYKTLKSIKKTSSRSDAQTGGHPSKAAALLKKARASAAVRQARFDNRPGKIRFDPDLPITAKKDEIIQAIRSHPVVIISGETGSGKTTQIPKFCLEAGRGTGGMIGCTQPRRIAAMTVARRIAFELDESLGQSVGYKIRFDDKTPSQAYIKLMTDGILLAETQQDRFLNQYDTLIVDEAHERSLNIDFTLGILRRLVKKRRNLKLIITSATIDTEKFSKAFDNAPVIEVSGRMYPVELIYSPIESAGTGEKGGGAAADDQGYVEAAARKAANLLVQTRAGDILIFMPTEQDIGETMELLRGRNMPGVDILPLFARLSAKEQAKVFSTGAGRKVVVSTNVAETSLTIPGIKYVIDTGLARIPAYSPRTRTTALPVSPISQSSANQRMGRCGRVENGVCIRLYDEEDFNGRPFFTVPEILRSNLAEVILRMISLNLGEVSTFPFIDPPAPKSIKDGFDTLLELSAIRPKQAGKNKKAGKSSGKKEVTLTPTGKVMARLPVDPKLSRILIEAADTGCLKEAVVIATALTVSDIRQRPSDKAQAADQQHARFKDPSSDFITLLNIWNSCREAANQLKSRSRLRKWCISHYLSFKRLREWQDIHRQITRMLKDHGIVQAAPLPDTIGSKGAKSKAFEHGGPLYIAIHKALLHGYLAGIAHKKEKNTFMAAKGQQAMIFPGSGLFNKAGNWIVASEYVKTSQLFARGVANIDPGWLEKIGKDLCTRTYSDPHWEKKRGEVVAKEQVSLFGLIIVNNRRVAYGRINPEESGEIFIRHALVQGEIFQKFGFMAHNQNLIRELEDLENKTRKRDILASEDDIYTFYLNRLPKPFFNIRTFARFVKDLKDDSVLRMTRADLQKTHVEETLLSQFPDRMDMNQGEFALAYDFNPGAETDGVTLKVPADSAALVSRNLVDTLVPGLFEEKIAALIKNLPKKHRVRLVPVQETAARIARELPRTDTPLYTLLSEFIREKYRFVIPASAWSDKALPDHLKMRISIRDEKDKEIRSLRDLSKLGQITAPVAKSKNTAFAQACQRYERSRITTWDFPDLLPDIPLDREGGFVRKVFMGLKTEESGLSLRLFKSESAALASHRQGICRLFELEHPDDIKALKKDIRSAAGLRQVAPYFNGSGPFQDMLYAAVAREFFHRNIRTQKEYSTFIQALRPQLYAKGQESIKRVMSVGREYESCFSLIQKLSLQYKSRPLPFEALTMVFNELKNLCPPNFLELYDLGRIRYLPRLLSCLKIRAQRAADNPAKENQKAELIRPFERRLEALVSGLTEEASPEKADAVEDFFWMLEEYKLSVYAQELKTRFKVSAKRLDKALIKISTLV